MPIGLPQPVINATRDECGIGLFSSDAVEGKATPIGRPSPPCTSAFNPDCAWFVSHQSGFVKKKIVTATTHAICSDGRGALELGTVHQPARRGVEGVAAVHRAAVIPPDQVADPPFLLPGEAFLAGVLPQEIQERLALLDREAEDIGVDAAAEVEA